MTKKQKIANQIAKKLKIKRSELIYNSNLDFTWSQKISLLLDYSIENKYIDNLIVLEIKELLKNSKFIWKQQKLYIKQKLQKSVAKSTTKLTTKEFVIYTEKIRHFFLEQYQIILPKPDPNFDLGYL